MEAYALRLLAEVFADQGLREQAVQTARRALRQFEQLNIRVEIETTKTMLDTF
jgi:hypothetical protein